MKKNGVFTLLIPALLVISCASKQNVYQEIDVAVNENQFDTAVKTLVSAQEAKNPIYSEKESIILFLDKGLLEHYAGNYKTSSENLQNAERLIEEAYTKSVTADIMSYIANDNIKEYPGEDFEDIYLNIFNALNYYKMGNTEGALVEVRKLSIQNGKLDMLARKYEYKDPKSGASLEDLAKKQAGDSQLPKGKPVEFSNSALARYLAALFYLADGKIDSSRIEFEQLQRAFLTNTNVYYNPLPKAIEESSKPVPAGKARLNVLSFTGLSPIKEEEIVVHYFPFFRTSVLHIANFKLPKMAQRPSKINRIEVLVNKEGGSETQNFELELLEDMGKVIEETFAIRYASTVVKTYIRTLLKYVATDLIAAGIAEKQSELLALVSAITAKAIFEETEKADIRMSRYLPDKAYIGGINLDPGKYDVTINFYSANNLISSENYSDVQVRERTLNLIDSVNLR